MDASIAMPSNRIAGLTSLCSTMRLGLMFAKAGASSSQGGPAGGQTNASTAQGGTTSTQAGGWAASSGGGTNTVTAGAGGRGGTGGSSGGSSTGGKGTGGAIGGSTSSGGAGGAPSSAWTGEPSAPLTGDYGAEGPSPLLVDGQMILFFDKFADGLYGALRSGALDALTTPASWTDISSSVFFAGVRHGTAIEVPFEAFRAVALKAGE